MGLLILILLLIAALTGALWSVFKIAVGVALGLFVGTALIGAFAMWRIRRALNGAARGPWDRGEVAASRGRWRRIGRSRIEVLDRGES